LKIFLFNQTFSFVDRLAPFVICVYVAIVYWLFCRDLFHRERLGLAFPKLFWQWERRSHSQERNSWRISRSLHFW